MAKDVDLTSKEWCDLVFEGKNKEYGAYAMRQQSDKRHNRSMVVVVLVVIFAFLLPYIIDFVVPEKQVEDVMDVVTELSNLEEAEVKKNEEVQPIAETPPPPPLKSSIKFTAPVIKKDEEVNEEDEIRSQEELTESKVTISIADVEGNDEENGQDIADFREAIAEEVEEEVIYEAVEQMPGFPGGDAELMKYIRDNLKYPVIAQELGIQGRVILRFVVSKTGEVGDIKVLRSVDPNLDKEAIRVVQSMPRWIPGKQNGNAVPVYFTLPVSFKLM